MMSRAPWTPASLAALLAVGVLTLSCQKSGTVDPERGDRAGAEPVAAGGVWADGAIASDASGNRGDRVDTLSAWAADNVEGERYQVPVEQGDVVFGAADARVTIVVFNDYQCPYCGRLDRALRDLVSTYPTDVRVVIKQFPLAMHGRARPAAHAVLAAHVQGRGEQMHALVFDNAGALDDDNLRQLAVEARVPDPSRFAADLVNAQFEAQVERDIALGTRLGVSSTPYFFVNGVAQRGAKSLEDLQQIYLAEVEAVNPLIAAGAERSEVYEALLGRAPVERAKPARKPSAAAQARPGRPDPAARYAIPVDGRPSIGPANAPVTIVEFADVECPYCRKVEPTLNDLRTRYGNDIRVVFYQNPLPMHKNAKDAALAMLAAERQGEFLDMRDRLHELADQRQLAPGVYEAVARDLGLDLKRFRKDLADPKLDAQITEDQAVARKFGATGTPSFFINGRPLSGAQPIEAFTSLIDEEMAAAKAYARKHKVKASKLYETMAKDWEPEVGTPSVAAAGRQTVSVKDLPVRGKANKPELELVVCADFDCPYCGRAASTVDDVLADPRYRNKVGFYFLHFPLPMHKDADIASRAAIAAGNQGKFWEMHDLLFADKSKRSSAELDDMARQLGLDGKRFRKDLDSRATADKVKADIATCSKLGVSGTPNFFVNGRSVKGAVPLESLAEVFDEELAGG